MSPTGDNFLHFEKCIKNTQYHSQNMFHDVLHRLEAKIVKIFGPHFSKVLQVNVPHWGQFSAF